MDLQLVAWNELVLDGLKDLFVFASCIRSSAIHNKTENIHSYDLQLTAEASIKTILKKLTSIPGLKISIFFWSKDSRLKKL